MPFRNQMFNRAGRLEMWLTGGTLGGGVYSDLYGTANFGTATSSHAKTVNAVNVNRNEGIMIASLNIPANMPPFTNAFQLGMAVAGGASTPFEVILRWI